MQGAAAYSRHPQIDIIPSKLLVTCRAPRWDKPSPVPGESIGTLILQERGWENNLGWLWGGVPFMIGAIVIMDVAIILCLAYLKSERLQTSCVRAHDAGLICCKPAAIRKACPDWHVVTRHNVNIFPGQMALGGLPADRCFPLPAFCDNMNRKLHLSRCNLQTLRTSRAVWCPKRRWRGSKRPPRAVLPRSGALCSCTAIDSAVNQLPLQHHRLWSRSSG